MWCNFKSDTDLWHACKEVRRRICHLGGSCRDPVRVIRLNMTLWLHQLRALCWAWKIGAPNTSGPESCRSGSCPTCTSLRVPHLGQLHNSHTVTIDHNSPVRFCTIISSSPYLSGYNSQTWPRRIAYVWPTAATTQADNLRFELCWAPNFCDWITVLETLWAFMWSVFLIGILYWSGVWQSVVKNIHFQKTEVTCYSEIGQRAQGILTISRLNGQHAIGRAFAVT